MKQDNTDSIIEEAKTEEAEVDEAEDGSYGEEEAFQLSRKRKLGF